jgi:phenylacetate-coenzyme A ligase PaaK-like adenylate-forming protein
MSLLKNENRIFSISNDGEFERMAMEIFQLQAANNPVYKLWIDMLKVEPLAVKSLAQIPFLPIEFFKNFNVVSSPVTSKTVSFKSSATTGAVPSTHYVNDVQIYEESFLRGFRMFYGEPADYAILALLPNYLQRKGSSLVYMCDHLIRLTGRHRSGFFLDDRKALLESIEELTKSGQKTILIGVSYALLDLCEAGITLPEHFIVMETGGMKGTRREMLKAELHQRLKEGLGVRSVHSEYGMTELLSQAYSRGDGLFDAPPWLRFLIRETDDPLKTREDGRTGGINVIDLANVNYCSFIATKDLGRLHEGRRLELLGRYDESDVRGCNLMIENFS